jgi:hypothetical protein
MMFNSDLCWPSSRPTGTDQVTTPHHQSYDSAFTNSFVKNSLNLASFYDPTSAAHFLPHPPSTLDPFDPQLMRQFNGYHHPHPFDNVTQIASTMNVNVSMNFNSPTNNGTTSSQTPNQPYRPYGYSHHHHHNHQTPSSLPPTTSSSSTSTSLSEDQLQAQANNDNQSAFYHHSFAPKGFYHHYSSSFGKHYGNSYNYKKEMYSDFLPDNEKRSNKLQKTSHYAHQQASSNSSCSSSSSNGQLNGDTSTKPPIDDSYVNNPDDQNDMSASNNNNSNDARVNRCRICGKTYARPSTLKTHMRTHSVSDI